MTDALVEHAPVPVISRSRLEMLFDGVFAIAMTILVLELRVPDLVDRHSVSELAHDLALHSSTFASYLLSFWVLGIFWYRHNHQYHHFRAITRGMLFLHFVQLAAAAFFPFCAALFGRYPFNPVAALCYIGCILVYGLASMGNWIVAEKTGSLVDGISPERTRKSRNRMIRGAVLIVGLFVFYLVKALKL